MADELAEVNGAAKNEVRGLLLQFDGSAVGPEERLLVHTNGSRIKNCLAVLGLRKQQNSPARTRRASIRRRRDVRPGGFLDRGRRGRGSG